MEKPLAGSNPMLHFQIRTPSTGVRPSTTLFHGLLVASPRRITARVVWRIEDRAGFRNMDFTRALRKNLTDALSNEFDKQYITGNGTARPPSPVQHAPPLHVAGLW